MFKTAKFQIRQRRYQPNLTEPNLRLWWLWLLALMDTAAGTALAVLKFDVCGYRPIVSALVKWNYLLSAGKI